uniref:Uncharacterized protein n=1 Tax=Panagrellus redivivus TaxID=6233 RepID=A0A7E4ZZB5_PANRE
MLSQWSDAPCPPRTQFGCAKGKLSPKTVWTRNRKIWLRIRVLGLGSEAPKIWLRREDPERSLRNVQNGSGSGGSVQAPEVTALLFGDSDPMHVGWAWAKYRAGAAATATLWDRRLNA